MSAPLEFHASGFGGGWLIPLDTPAGDGAQFVAESVIGEPDYPLMPFGGKLGWIIEPQDVTDIIGAIRAAGYEVEVN